MNTESTHDKMVHDMRDVVQKYDDMKRYVNHLHGLGHISLTQRDKEMSGYVDSHLISKLRIASDSDQDNTGAR
jgi:hypothetical protein